MKQSLAIESERKQSNRHHLVVNNTSPVSQAFVDHRKSTAIQRQLMTKMASSPQAIAQRQLSEQIHNSPYMMAQRQKMAKITGVAVQRVEGEEELMQGKFKPIQRAEDEELLQGKFDAVQRVEGEDELLQGQFQSIQRVEDEELMQGKFESLQRVEDEELLQGKFNTVQFAEASAEKQNNTGLPDNLKSGIENLSGMSMDHVKVHYNSSQPAQLDALAYAQGTDIYLGAGQEKHLPHEAWHVVQQAQGRVKPTMQMKDGVPVNDDQSLEHEADVMGAKAMQLVSMQTASKATAFSLQRVAQLRFDAGNGAQWHIHYEHIKLGTNTDSRVNFNGRTKKEIRKELGEKIDRYGLNVGGDLATSFRQCIDYINAHY